MAPNVGNNGSLRSRWSKNEKRFMQIPLTLSFHTADKHGDDNASKGTSCKPHQAIYVTGAWERGYRSREIEAGGQPRSQVFQGLLVVAAPPTKLLPRAKKYLEAKYVQSILDRLKLGIPLRLSPSPVPIQAFGQWESEQSNPLAFFLSPLFASLPTDQNAWNSSRCLANRTRIGTCSF